MLDADVEYSKHLHDLKSDLPFLGKRMKIKTCTKIVCNSYNQEKYVLHIRTLKQV